MGSIARSIRRKYKKQSNVVDKFNEEQVKMMESKKDAKYLLQLHPTKGFRKHSVNKLRNPHISNKSSMIRATVQLLQSAMWAKASKQAAK